MRYEIQQRLVVGWWIRQKSDKPTIAARQNKRDRQGAIPRMGSNCSTQQQDDSARNEIFLQARLATTAVARPHEQQQQEPRAKSQAVVAVHARVGDKDPHPASPTLLRPQKGETAGGDD